MQKKMFLTACLTACMVAGVCYFPVRDMARNVNLDTAADARDDGWRLLRMKYGEGFSFEGSLSNGELYIPASLYFQGDGNVPMRFMGYKAESGSDKPELIKVTMEDGAKFTEEGQFFRQCVNLNSVRLPADLTEIPLSCFSGCTGLSNISIPDSVTYISDNAFSGCTGLTEINIPSSVRKISYSAFAKCANLKSITIENPNCEIADIVDTIYGSYDYDTSVGNYRYNFDGTIYGYAGSTAEAYAKKYGWKFAVIGSTPTEPDVPQTPPLAPAGSYYGDVDGDGKITAADAQNVLMYYVDSFTGKTPSWKEITGNANAPS